MAVPLLLVSVPHDLVLGKSDDREISPTLKAASGFHHLFFLSVNW